MTNIAMLPQLQGSFVVATNGDWRDVLQFNWPVGSTQAGQPLDLTGISFEAQVRPAIADAEVLLEMSTDNGLLQVDAPLGQLAFAVPEDTPSNATAPGHTSGLPAGVTAVMDIIARGDGKVINLGQYAGPFPVKITPGVTRR